MGVCSPRDSWRSRSISKMASLVSSAGPNPHFIARSFLRKSTHLTGRILIALGLIAAVTFICFRVVPVNATTAGFFYLVAILTIATVGGLVESTIASVVAMLCFNYFFLPPIGTFTVADPQNWVALFTFLATSLTASRLSARAKRPTHEAEERRAEVERLYALSRALLLVDTSQPIAKQIVHQVALTCGFPGVALYVRANGEIYRVGLADTDVESKLRESAVRRSEE